MCSPGVVYFPNIDSSSLSVWSFICSFPKKQSDLKTFVKKNKEKKQWITSLFVVPLTHFKIIELLDGVQIGENSHTGSQLLGWGQNNSEGLHPGQSSSPWQGHVKGQTTQTHSEFYLWSFLSGHLTLLFLICLFWTVGRRNQQTTETAPISSATVWPKNRCWIKTWHGLNISRNNTTLF